MANLTRRAALFLVPLAAGAALAGCQTSKSTPAPTGDMNPADLAFVTDAFNIIEFDRQECTLAKTEAKSADVKALAAQFLDQANDFDAKLRPVAMQAGIMPPTVLRTDLRTRVARLRQNGGVDFDRSFVEDQIVSHQDTLNIQEMIVGEPSASPQLQAMSKQGTELIRANLAKLRELQRKMIMMKR